MGWGIAVRLTLPQKKPPGPEFTIPPPMPRPTLPITHRAPTLLATGRTTPGVVEAMKYPKARAGSWRALTLRSFPWWGIYWNVTEMAFEKLLWPAPSCASRNQHCQYQVSPARTVVE